MYHVGPFLPITPERIKRLPKWAREYVHHVDTFIGAEEVQEIFYLRDQNRALIKFVAELKTENRRLQSISKTAPETRSPRGKFSHWHGRQCT